MIGPAARVVTRAGTKLRGVAPRLVSRIKSAGTRMKESVKRPIGLVRNRGETVYTTVKTILYKPIGAARSAGSTVKSTSSNYVITPIQTGFGYVQTATLGVFQGALKLPSWMRTSAKTIRGEWKTTVQEAPKFTKRLIEQTSEEFGLRLIATTVASVVSAIMVGLAAVLSAVLESAALLLETVANIALEPLFERYVDAFGGGTPQEQLAANMLFVAIWIPPAVILWPLAIFPAIHVLFFLQAIRRKSR